VEFNPVNNNIYAANIGSNSVSVVDSNSKVGDIIVIGNNLRGIEFNPANNNIYVANSGSNTVSVISS
jgi:YVTN family beta-propeller protein